MAEGCYFDQAAADWACDFIEGFCKHTSAEWFGQPVRLLPWQRDFVSRLYGWKRADGTRRFREFYLEIPKKAGKSTLIACLCLLALVEEPGAEVYPGAVNRKQSDPIYRTICQMIRSSPDLKAHLKVLRWNKSITFEEMNSRLKVLSADADSEDGHNSNFTVLDELHRFKNTRLYDVMRYAGKARRQPIFGNITTAGESRHSLCYEVHNRARAVIDGTSTETRFLGVIYGADPEVDDLDDPKTWLRVNPSLGAIGTLADFREEYETAKKLPRTLNEFLRLNLGVWVESSAKWLPLDLWDKGKDPVPASWWKGVECFAAIDLSAVKDLTSLSLAARLGDKQVRVAVHPFMPSETKDRRSEVDGVPYGQWCNSGDMIETDGNSTDHEAIRQRLIDLRDMGVEIKQVGVDPWGADHLCNLLRDDGFDVVLFGQNYQNLSGPSKHLERLLLAGDLRHDGNPVMRWCVGNVAVDSDPHENIKPSKKRSAERIDCVVSTVMAIGLMDADPNQGPPTFTVIKRDRK